MKRKLLILFMALSLVTLCVACGDKNKENNVSVETDKNLEGLHFGNVSGTSYSAQNFGFKAEFNENWILYSENEILEWNNFSTEDEVKETDIKSGDAYTEFVAYDSTNTDSVIIRSEKLDEGQEVDINELAAVNKPEYEEYYTSVEYTDIVSEISTVKFLGEDVTAININCNLDGEPTCLSVVYVETNDYLLTFEVCSDDLDGVQTVLDCFKTN